MKYFKKIEGSRIYLSPMNIDDLEIYTKWLNDCNVTNGIHGTHKMINLETEKEYLNKCLSNGDYQFAIVKKENDELIGNCGIDDISFRDQNGVIGLFIGEEENRNKGYGKEAIDLLLEYCFNYLNLNNIMLKVFSFNERAIKCYKKVGFKEIGRRRKCCYLNGKFYDDVYMDILKEEYFK